jgi:hypothetical protein
VFIVWRQKLITSDRKVRLFIVQFTEYTDIPVQPIACTHRGPGRVAWTPLLMHAERVDGQPRQKLLRRLPTLRSCCMQEPFTLAAWWYAVRDWIRFWEEEEDGEASRFIARDKKAILQKLREVAPQPSRTGVRLFKEHLLAQEAERDRRECQEAQDQAAARQRRQQEQAWRDKSVHLCWSVLGLPATATVEQVKHRYRKLALEHHPDRGGDNAVFEPILAAYKQALQLLGVG